jgi:hypothetical protein
VSRAAAAAALAVIAIVVAAGTGTADAAPRPPGCRADAVAIAHHGHRVCLALSALRRRQGAAAAGTPRLLVVGASAGLARRLGNRSARRLPARARALGLELARQAAARRSAPAVATGARRHRGAHAAQTSTGPLPDGGTETVVVQPAPPGQSGAGGSASITKEVTMSGKQVVATAGFGTEQFAQLCPGVAGEDPGRVSFHYSTELTVPLEHRLRLVVASQFDGTGRVTGHVGPNGRLRDFDLAVDLTIAARGRIIGPAGVIHGDPVERPLRIRAVFVGLHPADALGEMLDTAHIGSLSISGPEGSGRIEARDGGLFMPKEFIDGYLTGAMLLADHARSALHDTEGHYFDGALCLTAAFTPGTLPDTLIGERRDAAVAVVSKVDGKEQSFDLDLTPSRADVSATRVHAAPGAPAAFWMVPSAPGLRAGAYAGVEVGGTSVRGRVSGSLLTRILERPKAWAYAVSFAGTGSYAENQAHVDASSQIQHHATTSFSFRSDWDQVVLPADGSASRTPLSLGSGGQLSGAAESSGTQRGSSGQSSSYHCSAPLADLSAARPAALRLQMAPANGRFHEFTVAAAQTLAVDPGQGACTTDGAFFSSMIPAAGWLGLVDLPPALVGLAIYTDDDVGKPSFTSDVIVPALAEHCSLGDQGADHCTHSLTWNGRVTFTRIARCQPADGGGYACEPPR